MAGGLCFLFILTVSLLTLNGCGASLKWRLFNITFVTGATFTIMTYLLLILVQKNYTAEGENIVAPWQYWFLPTGFVFGFLLARYFMAQVSKPEASTGTKLGFMFSLVTFDLVEEAIMNDTEPKVTVKGDRIDKKASYIDPVPASRVPGIYLMTEQFRLLMVAAAFLVCLSHGSNDVANAISPLLVVQQAHAESVGNLDYSSKAGYWIGSLGIALGLLVLGIQVMETVGKKVIKLNFVVGFCAQLSTAISVIAGSLLGLPLSTTHCMVGSLLGVVLAKKMNFINFAYCSPD